jgi:hypothetical protein
MNQSEKLDQLATALAKAQASLSGAKKSALNPHFKSHYSTLQDVWDSGREVLAPNGLSVVQTYEATDGKLMNIRTTLLHTSGQWIAGVLSMAPQQATPQGIASASTFGRRYGLTSILGIVSDDDDDGNEATEPGRDKPVFKPATAPVRQSPPVTHTVHGAPVAAKETGNPNGWRSTIVPPFIKKYAGQTLGDMAEKDLLWWAGNYTPKEYKGSIQQKDLDLRAAFDAAQAELTGTRPQMPDAQKYNEGPTEDAEIPF